MNIWPQSTAPIIARLRSSLPGLPPDVVQLMGEAADELERQQNCLKVVWGEIEHYRNLLTLERERYK